MQQRSNQGEGSPARSAREWLGAAKLSLRTLYYKCNKQTIQNFKAMIRKKKNASKAGRTVEEERRVREKVISSNARFAGWIKINNSKITERKELIIKSTNNNVININSIKTITTHFSLRLNNSIIFI